MHNRVILITIIVFSDPIHHRQATWQIPNGEPVLAEVRWIPKEAARQQKVFTPAEHGWKRFCGSVTFTKKSCFIDWPAGPLIRFGIPNLGRKRICLDDKQWLISCKPRVENVRRKSMRPGFTLHSVSCFNDGQFVWS